MDAFRRPRRGGPVLVVDAGEQPAGSVRYLDITGRSSQPSWALGRSILTAVPGSGITVKVTKYLDSTDGT
jgi:hypothetical protein